MLVGRASALIGSVQSAVIPDCGSAELPAPPPWHKGRIVLLGDAVHAFLPYLGQGAAQAIENGGCSRHAMPVASRDLPGRRLARDSGSPGGKCRARA
jgi:flavin-dependent dehydrogenase